ncbi:oligoendopeptidase F [Vibrio sp. 10N.286.49.C2]|uniref:M3 family oligoendopeptidase n=1 Tax=unclassified Vibrio TaxID=2614977 RepID=UPI000C868494|nr:MULTISPECIES: M3 family oligoendopeptidase [unclassified Vibrio]PMH31523.1 oligoendopeptidase F [Vibrio sp. 10N.286.49.C2]PMH50544.1 oligoendopeptidase F [Vibrio sp. 10N.286.49.B1]PMH77974.1 oligoendopeptidase F [Vibrio sp. 10N.286.48.B7]
MNKPIWDLTIAYRDLSDSKIEQDIELIQRTIELLNRHQDERAQVTAMQNAIQTKSAASTLLATVNTLATCYASTNASNTQAKQLIGRIAQLSSQLDQAFTPYENTLALANTDFIEQVLEHEDPSVAGQGFQIELLQRKAQTQLSIPEEQLLSAMQVDGRDAWGRLYDNITGALQITMITEQGPETVGFSQAASLLYGSEFSKQQAAWEGIQAAMKQNATSFAAILNALAGWRLNEAKKRSAQQDEHFLDSSLRENRIQRETLDAMMSVAKSNQHIGQRAGRLMARVHGSDKMTPWNHLAAMPSLNDSEPQVYSFSEGIEVIKSAFLTVDPAMAEFVQTMVDNGWIDAEPSENRRLGAYCTKLAATRTPLVFMTWGGSRSDLLTLAHELGHAFHNWVMRDLPLCRTRYPMTLAETASIFAENIVRDYLLSHASTPEQKLEMLWEELSSAYALTINIPVRYEFEKAFYQAREEAELDSDQLCQLMSETWQAWYGDSMEGQDPYFWASKLHFSISELSFYNYPYLFGYLFSLGVYAQRPAKGPTFYPDYVALLRDTGSYVAEQVVSKHMGSDLTQSTFWQESMARLEQKVDEFEALLNEVSR